MSTPRPNYVRPAQGRYEALLDEIGFRITSGVIAAGQVLRLEDFEKEFGLSRSVTREAVRVLESLGMLRIARRVGITVQPDGEWSELDPRIIGWRLADESRRSTELHHLTQLRYGIEPTAAEYMAEVASRSERARLLLCAENMIAASDDIDEFTRLDVEFHSMILGGTGNALFNALVPTFTTGLMGRADYHLLPNNLGAESLERHLEIAQAIFDSDGARAAEVLRALLREVDERFGE